MLVISVLSLFCPPGKFRPGQSVNTSGRVSQSSWPDRPAKVGQPRQASQPAFAYGAPVKPHKIQFDAVQFRRTNRFSRFEGMLEKASNRH